ncbi:hypothetical protein LJB82_00775 [Desulfovibrio sp. OttesenSCG-928-M16]|nr:hypothetical protein [Desulfovibrio sp. OttesenSCG-928-M16]
MRRFYLSLLVTLLFALPAVAEERHPIPVNESSALPLRVLTRPLSSLYKDASESTVLQSNLPTFQSYFVYTRPMGEELDSGSGWYEVGTDEKGTIAGWIKAGDLFEWKQTMCLAYTHPEGRQPVLMFEDEEPLAALAGLEDDKRRGEVAGYYAEIDKAAAAASLLPKDFPVVSVEPKMAVDLAKQFYLLPILEHKSLNIEGREGRLLRIAAVSGSGEGARESSDLRSNSGAVQAAATESASAAGKLEDLKFDVVFVMDTTRSMQPYIAKVTEVVRTISKNIAANPALNEKIAFGVWAYRDSMSIPDIGYLVNNFTPQLKPVEDFLPVLEQVKETATDSVDMPEDMFAGLEAAITQTAWRGDEAMRIIVLVGDAPSHELGHKWNSSGQDENTLRILATQNRINLLSLHVMNPNAAKRHHKTAERQFKALAVNPGSDMPFYWGVNSNDIQGFAAISEDITATVADFAQAGQTVFADAPPMAGTDPALTGATGQAQGASGSASGPTRADIQNMLKAAAVTWLGSQTNAQAPRDVEAWVADKDLADPSRQSLEVRLLINKRQLDSLATLLDEVLQAGRYNQISGEDFFSSLQAASAVASRNPDMLSSAPNLAKSGLIPDFLSNLPYTSQLMDMNNDLWASWGPDEQDSFLNQIEAKVKAYASMHDNPEIWVALNMGDDAAEYVAPVPLELLP